MKIPIDQIIIGERQRLDIGDLSDLDSMSDPDVGQIHPIVVHKTLQGMELIAGRRRLAKATSLGWTHIEAHEKDLLTESQKNKMELLEDVARLDRPWQDRCLSIAKVHYLLQKEKGKDGIAWTTKHTSIISGLGTGASTVRRMLVLAELLAKEPKDQECWDCKTFYEAFAKCVVDRNEVEARKELERRRALLNQEQMMVPSPAEGEDNWADGEATEEGPKSEGYILTQTAQAPTKIRICGTNMAFDKAVPDEHFISGSYAGVLAHDMPASYLVNALAALRPTSYATFWFSSPTHNLNSFISSLRVMPWRLIWNKIALYHSTWPFCENYGIGVVFAGEDLSLTHELPNPSSSIISAMPEQDGTLPYPVVVATLTPTVPPNQAVLCPFNAPVIAVAEAGYVPVFFEEDKEKFDKKVEALRNYYQQTIPNAEIILRQ